MSRGLVVEQLEVNFGGFKAVDGFSMKVEDGELRVLLGPNGAGKTTLMDLISGKTKSTGGKVLLNGEDITDREEHLIARQGIGRKFQIPSIFQEMTVLENLQVAESQEFSVIKNIFKRTGGKPSARVERVLKQIDLEPLANTPAGSLSHGQTQWLELGMLLVQGPHVILLDEPTAGMTVEETRKTAEIINSMKGKHTLLVVEHDMGFVRSIAEKITVMHQGKLLAEGSVAEIENNPAVIEAYLGGKKIEHA